MHPKPLLVIVSYLVVCTSFAQDKIYSRTYHDNGKIASEGWLRYNVPTDYWTFYHENGKVSEQGSYKYGKRHSYWFFYNEHKVRTKEGHYQNGEKTKWWLFYDHKGRIIHKCQLNKGIKNGYCLKYKNEKLTAAEKYKNGKKIKEWTTFGAFTKENSLSDLK